MPGIAVRESGRARRLSIKVFPRGRVEVVVPRRTPPTAVQAFVTEHRDWIHRALKSFGEEHVQEALALPAAIRLDGIGRTVAVSYRPEDDARSVRYREAGDTLILSGATRDVDQCVRTIRRWLSVVAKRELPPRLRALSLRHDLPYRKTQVRAQRTCWGSRSSTGTISLNLCLLFLEPPVVTYLMIHELCHGRHMNHSRRFWRLVGTLEPEYRRLDKALSDSWRRVPGWLGLY
jgi:predicted metal-dependent hydrolase